VKHWEYNVSRHAVICGWCEKTLITRAEIEKNTALRDLCGELTRKVKDYHMNPIDIEMKPYPHEKCETCDLIHRHEQLEREVKDAR
jgi:hypothetical protein